MSLSREPKPKKQRLLATAGTAGKHNEHEFDSANPLLSLPPDALISVLCRVPACDHTALWNSCGYLRETLDSDAYASERAATGWAEVTARLVSGEEMYDLDYPDGPELDGDDDSYNPNDDINDDNDDLTEEERAKKEARKRRWEDKREQRRREAIETYYSELGRRDESYKYDDITVDIRVDGIKAGYVDLVRIPRPRYGEIFLDAADAHSQELQEVGWSLCDSRGRPKVRSIKEADTDGKAKRGGFLHVKQVRIRKVCRPLDNTNVVASAVRAALTVPELEGKWSLATAVSDMSVYMSNDDEKRLRNMMRDSFDSDHNMGANENTDADTDRLAREEEKKKLSERWKECMKLDARTFLRVGYKQIPEVVGAKKDEPAWLFALPKFLEKPIMSHEESVAIKMIEPPDLPPGPVGVDKELFATLKTASNVRKVAIDTIASANRTLDEMNQNLRKIWDEEVANIERFNELESRFDELTAEQRAEIEAEMNAMRSGLNALKRKHDTTTFEQYLAEKRNEIAALGEAGSVQKNIREKFAKADEALKTKVTTLVNDKGASVRKSFVLHCSARFLITEFMDILLELVPANERAAAINDIDTNGCTPLHCALMGTPELSNADMYYRAVQHLLRLGADKNIMDVSGRTPLGQYRSVIRSRNEYEHVFISTNSERGDTDAAWKSIHQRMVEVLMPIGGETNADRDADGDQGSESFEDEEDFEDEGDY